MKTRINTAIAKLLPCVLCLPLCSCASVNLSAFRVQAQAFAEQQAKEKAEQEAAAAETLSTDFDTVEEPAAETPGTATVEPMTAPNASDDVDVESTVKVKKSLPPETGLEDFTIETEDPGETETTAPVISAEPASEESSVPNPFEDMGSADDVAADATDSTENAAPESQPKSLKPSEPLEQNSDAAKAPKSKPEPAEIQPVSATQDAAPQGMQFYGDDEELNLAPFTIIPSRNRRVHARNVSRRLTPPEPPQETAEETTNAEQTDQSDGTDSIPATASEETPGSNATVEELAQPDATGKVTLESAAASDVIEATEPDDDLPEMTLQLETPPPANTSTTTSTISSPQEVAPEPPAPGVVRIKKDPPPVTEFSPGGVRIELKAPTPGVPMRPEVVLAPGATLDYPDEFLFDGGDRSRPVTYGNGLRYGLNTEDTVAEYTDHTGETHMKPTNRVAIYAPYFAAVRSFSGLRERNNVTKLAASQRTTGGAGLKTKQGHQAATEHAQLQGVRMRARPSGIDGDAVLKEFKRNRKAIDHVKLLNAFEEFAVLRRQQFNLTNQPRLAITRQAARAWSRDLYPQITGSRTGPVEIYDNIKAQIHIGIDDGKRTKGCLQIVKAADRQIASPGDEITFAIRYNNIGDYELRDITIVDNLTPRLKFIKDSEESDRPGKLDTTDNGEGSVVVRFRLKDALPGHEGGLLTFKVRVE